MLAYAKGAEEGCALSAAALGLIYDEGRGGVAVDPEQANRWFTKAIQAGEPLGAAAESWGRLGNNWFGGRGTGKKHDDNGNLCVYGAHEAGDPNALTFLTKKIRRIAAEFGLRDEAFVDEQIAKTRAAFPAFKQQLLRASDPQGFQVAGMDEKRQRLTCSECRGTGRIKKPWFRSEACKVCNGLGQVDATRRNT